LRPVNSPQKLTSAQLQRELATAAHAKLSVAGHEMRLDGLDAEDQRVGDRGGLLK
jgi:hypothetical protein